MKNKKINQNDLIEILHTFGQNNRIFQSEAQFQFDLAWKIRERLQTEYAEICLEEMTVQEKDSNKRFYSDIVIKYHDQFYDVIELKYKTKESTYYFDNDKKIISLLNHGARDLGRYDYLYDLHRIQLLKNHNSKKYTYSLDYSFHSGYAIILTNDNHYWKQTKEKAQNVLYKNFCIGDGDIIEQNSCLKWTPKNTEKNCIKGTWRENILQFDKTHVCKWRDYFASSGEPFKFLLLEV